MKSRFRHRLYPTLPPSPLDPWINLGLSLLASSGAAAAALALQLGFGVHPIFAWSLAFAIVFLPPFGRRFRILHGSEEGDRLQAMALAFFTGLPLLLALPQPSLASLSLIALLVWHGFLLRFSRPGGAAVLAMLLPVLEVLFAIEAIWDRGWTARLLGATWMLVTILGGAVLVTWVHARSTRRSLPPRHFTHHQPAETEAGLWDRARLVFLLGAVLLPLGLLLQQGALLLTPSGTSYVALGDPDDVPPEQALPQPPPPPPAEPEAASSGAEEEQAAPRWSFPEDVAWYGNLMSPSPGNDSVLAEIHYSEDTYDGETYQPSFTSANPLYLVGTTLDTLTTTGLARSLQGESVYYADSGLGPNGWAVFDSSTPMRQANEFRIRLRNMPLNREGVAQRESILLHGRRLVAMKMPSVRLGTDGTALTDLTDSVLAYHWMQVPVDEELPLRAAAIADRRYTAIPEGDPRFAVWAQEARDLCADLSDPEDKVQRILSHFRRRFYYDPQPSQANGIEAFADFFGTRSGYCTYFASAAMLYLRANGIPSRVATGFLVTDFDPQRGAYYAHVSDAHAWIEVLLSDGSWRTLEPTPTSRRREALDALVAGLDYETLPPVEMGQYVEPPAVEEQPWEEIVLPEMTIRERIITATLSLLSMLGLALAACLSILAVSRMIMSFRGGYRPRTPFAALPAEAAQSLAYWTRIEGLLAHLGFHRRRSQTSAEFAHHVERWGGAGYGRLPQVVSLVYRTRFGGHAWRPSEEILLRRFEEALERKVLES